MSEGVSEHGYGTQTAALLESVFARGINRAVVLMRHSAREYARDRHDLLNPLTEEGRVGARRFGEALPKHLTVRAYASPPDRCMETAALVLAGHEARGGAITRHRPLEALGVFYALDQIKMWQGMQAAGMLTYLGDWFEGRVPADALMPADVASRLLLAVLTEKLRSPVAEHHLDVCVSHDMTLYLMRTMLLRVPLTAADVAYLDGIVLFEENGALKLRGLAGVEMTVTDGDA